jgi:hypothetical protein
LKFRRIPHLVDAAQWNPADITEAAMRDAREQVLRELPGLDIKVFPAGSELDAPDRTVHSLDYGDWIVRHTYDDGTVCVYVIPADAFDRSHRRVEYDYYAHVAGPGFQVGADFDRGEDLMHVMSKMGDELLAAIEKHESQPAPAPASTPAG